MMNKSMPSARFFPAKRSLITHQNRLWQKPYLLALTFYDSGGKSCSYFNATEAASSRAKHNDKSNRQRKIDSFEWRKQSGVDVMSRHVIGSRNLDHPGLMRNDILTPDLPDTG